VARLRHDPSCTQGVFEFRNMLMLQATSCYKLVASLLHYELDKRCLNALALGWSWSLVVGSSEQGRTSEALN
jgi:hypothetical protein